MQGRCPSYFREGAGKAGYRLIPMAPVQQKSTGKEPQVQPDTRPSLRSGLRLTPRSPRGPGFLAPVILRIVTTRLSASVGAPGPHDFAVRVAADRLRHQPVHRIPHATSVTTRPPLFKSGAGRGENAPDLGLASRHILKIGIRRPRQIGTTGIHGVRFRLSSCHFAFVTGGCCRSVRTSADGEAPAGRLIRAS
jgi:hypothetical protein